MGLFKLGGLATLSVVVGLLVCVNASKRLPWWQMKVTQSQGPNACIVEEVPDLNRKYWTECKYWPVRKVCGKETIIRYECCEGFKQINGEEGCTGVKSMKDVLETARELGARRFVDYLELSGLANQLRAGGPFTLFAPLDSAFDTNGGATLAGRITRSQFDPILNYHVSNEKVISSQFTANSHIVSRHNSQKLRISKYSTGMETVDCVLISRKDQEATNGVVHIIDSILDPYLYIPRDVGQIVIQDGRFRKMADAIERCGFAERLRDRDGTFTFLAPSDEAFLKIPPLRLEKMLRDPAACTAMLENHLIPHVMCVPVITEEVKARSVGSHKLNFDCDGERGVSVEGNRLSEFLLGQNGLVYVINDVLVPDRAKTVMELIDDRHLTTLSRLTRLSGLDEMLNGRGDFTFFGPGEAAWDAMDADLLSQAKENPDLARRILLFHGSAEGRIKTSMIQNNQVVRSLDDENPLRLEVYRKAYGVEDAIIKTADIEGSNGVLHIISRVLFPATESAGDVLRKSGNYTIFLETMESMLREDPDAIDLSRNGDRADGNHYTFFVPTDNAFRALGHSRLRRIQTDPYYKAKLLRNHISNSIASSESFKPKLVYDMPTRQDAVGISCDERRRMKINNAEVVQKDMMATNGIIHAIDRLLDY